MVMTKKQIQKEEIKHAEKRIKEILKPGDIVYTVLKHVSSSGMTRHISLYAVKDNEILDITYYVAKLLGYKRNDKNGGLIVGGCGMDMGYHVVYSLSRRLFKDGFVCSGKNCNAAIHFNEHTPKVAGEIHTQGDGGYALNHRWM